MTTTTLKTRTWHTPNDWHHEVLAKIGDTKVRVRIRLNFYPEQSYAECQMMTPAGWSQVCSLTMSETMTAKNHRSSTPENAFLLAALRHDTDTLLSTAEAILL